MIVNPVAAYASDQGMMATAAVASVAELSQGRYTRYSTAAVDNENYTDLELSGNSLQIRRRACRRPRLQDQVILKQYQTVSQDLKVDWTTYPVEGAYYGYNLTLDIAALPAGSHSVQVISTDAYINTVADVSFVKTAAGAYFPKSNTLSKQYNYETLRRLESGSAPDDFAELKKMYGTGDDAAVLAEIEARARQVVSGCDSDLNKVRAVNRWIAENVAYDNDADGDALYERVKTAPEEKVRLDSPLNAFREGYALCYGFARLTTLMMGYAGIDCVYITGRLAESMRGDVNAGLSAPGVLEKLNHAWNAVKIDGSWYFVDTSQDALSYYSRRDKSRADTGYTTVSRDPIYVNTLASLSEFSRIHIGLRLGVKNAGTKLSAAPVPDGWQQEGTALRYYEDGQKPKNTWKQIEGQNYHFDATGAVQKGWQLVDDYWRWFDDTGAVATGERTITDGGEEKTYLFDPTGCVTANNTWLSFGGAIRYFAGREMKTGWQFVEGSWRYFDETGDLYRDAKKPLKLAEGEYKVNDEGILQTEGGGWLTLGGEKLYFDETGMRTGLTQVDGREYLFDTRGAMQTGWQPADGKTYFFGEDGAMQTGWLFQEGAWFYSDRQLGLHTGAQSLGGATHFFTAQGRLSTSGWVDIGSGKLYYVDGKTTKGVNKGGKLMLGWKIVDGGLRYFDKTDGRMYTGSEAVFNENNQKWYTFSADGVATKVE